MGIWLNSGLPVSGLSDVAAGNGGKGTSHYSVVKQRAEESAELMENEDC